MTSCGDALHSIAEYAESGAFIRELSHLVSIGSESQEPTARAELFRYLNEAAIPLLEPLGFACRILQNPVNEEIPFLFAERIEDPSFETVLIYGHGDVVRAQSDQWNEGLAPFELVIEGNKAYGRGIADNKGQHLINFAALRAVIEARGALGFNVSVVLPPRCTGCYDL